MSSTANCCLDWAFLLLIYIIIYKTRLKSRDKWYRFVFTLFYFYITLVLFFTLMPFKPIILRGMPGIFVKFNIAPFVDIRLHHLYAKRDAVLNLIMFMPMGFLLPIVKKQGFFSVLFISVSVSFTIEAMQFLYSWSGGVRVRSADITDIITNTVGGILGFLLHLIFRPLLKKLREKFL